MKRHSLGLSIVCVIALVGCGSSGNSGSPETTGGGGTSGIAGRGGATSSAGSRSSGTAGATGGNAPGGSGGTAGGSGSNSSGGTAGASDDGSSGSSTGGVSAAAGASGSAGQATGAGGASPAVTADCKTLCAVWTKVSSCSLGSDCLAQCTAAANVVASPTKYAAMLACEANSLTKTSQYFCSGGPLIAADDGSGPAPTIHAATTTDCKQQICDFTCNEASNNGLYDTNVCTTDACQCSDC